MNDSKYLLFVSLVRTQDLLLEAHQSLSKANPLETDVEYLFDEIERLKGIVDVFKTNLEYYPRTKLNEVPTSIREDALMMYRSVYKQMQNQIDNLLSWE